MAQLFNVRNERGRLVTQCLSLEHAHREIEWQRASGTTGELSIEPIEREGDWERWGGCAPYRFGGRWPTAKVDEFRRRYGDGEPVIELAEWFGTNIMVICRMARRLGFVRRLDDPANFEKHRGRWTRREEELVNFMYDEGIGTTKIPDHIPRTTKAVEARLTATARELSTRSKFGRFIAKRKFGRKKTIHRVLEETGIADDD